MALASIICSVAGVFLITTCILAPISPVPLVLGAVFGYLASQQLPPNAEQAIRSQAQFGLWIGVAGSAIALLCIVLFATVFLLGILEGAATV